MAILANSDILTPGSYSADFQLYLDLLDQANQNELNKRYADLFSYNSYAKFSKVFVSGGGFVGGRASKEITVYFQVVKPTQTTAGQMIDTLSGPLRSLGAISLFSNGITKESGPIENLLNIDLTDPSVQMAIAVIAGFAFALIMPKGGLLKKR